MSIIIKKSYVLYLLIIEKKNFEFAFTLQVWSSVIEVAAFPSIAASRNDGDYREGFTCSLLLIACGTNSELSCSAISGLRRLFRSSSLSLRLESIDGFSTTVEDTRRRRAKAYFVIIAAASVRNTRKIAIACNSAG